MEIMSRTSNSLHRSNENLSQTASKSTESRAHRPRASTLPSEMLKRLREGKAMAKQGYETQARMKKDEKKSVSSTPRTRRHSMEQHDDAFGDDSDLHARRRRSATFSGDARTPKDENKPVSSTPRNRSRRHSIELQDDTFGEDSDHHARRRRSATFSGDGTQTARDGSASSLSSSRHCASPNVHVNAHSLGHCRQLAKTMPSDVKRSLMLKFGRPHSPGTLRTPTPPTPVTSLREESTKKESAKRFSPDNVKNETVVDGSVDNCSALIDACLYMASDEAGAVHRDPLPKGSNAFAQVMEELDPCKPHDVEKIVKKSHNKPISPKKTVKRRPQRHSSVIPPRPSELVHRESQTKSGGCSSAPNSPPTGRRIHWGKTVTFDNDS